MDPLADMKAELARETFERRLMAALPYAAAAFALLLLILAAREVYGYVTRSEHERATVALRAAAMDGDVATLTAYAAKVAGHHRAIAVLTAFARMDVAGQRAAGAESLRALMVDETVPADWRDLARLILVKSDIAAGGKDGAVLLDILAPVLARTDGPYYALAILRAALIRGEMMGDADGARALLAAIPDGGVDDEILDIARTAYAGGAK